MGTAFSFPWEDSVIVFLQNALPSWLVSVLGGFSFFGESFFVVAVIMFFLFCYDKKIGQRLAVNLVFSISFGSLLKNIVMRRRPYMDNENIKCLRIPESEGEMYDVAAQGFSFPSMHSANALTLWGSIFGEIKKNIFLVLAIVIPILIGISRVVNGVHYPTDVLGGFLVALLCIFGIPALEKLVKNRHISNLILIVILFPGFFFCKSEDYYTTTGLFIGIVAAIWFEEKFVGYEMTDKLLYKILRMVFGAAIFLVLNVLMKLPFSEEFLESGSKLCYLYRTFRYAVMAFVAMGVYPLLFAKVEKRNK